MMRGRVWGREDRCVQETVENKENGNSPKREKKIVCFVPLPAERKMAQMYPDAGTSIEPLQAPFILHNRSVLLSLLMTKHSTECQSSHVFLPVITIPSNCGVTGNLIRPVLQI